MDKKGVSNSVLMVTARHIHKNLTHEFIRGKELCNYFLTVLTVLKSYINDKTVKTVSIHFAFHTHN